VPDAVAAWHTIRQSLAAPYRVPAAMVLFLALVPLYILVPAWFPPPTRYVPELPLDRAWPLVPAWALVYGALYLFLILLPVFVVRQQDLIRRTVHAYLLIWIASYACFFVIYPTMAPRPEQVSGAGFGVWGLRALYGADPPYNCFPSLHVAHSFVSALAVSRVHRRLGGAAVVAALLVALSTLFTKQHYVLDVAGGIVLAAAAFGIFLLRYPASHVSEFDRCAAPALAACVGAVAVSVLLGAWLVYAWSAERHFTFGP
jgi:membrane-associated phospholipid phosphatase